MAVLGWDSLDRSIAWALRTTVVDTRVYADVWLRIVAAIGQTTVNRPVCYAGGDGQPATGR